MNRSIGRAALFILGLIALLTGVVLLLLGTFWGLLLALLGATALISAIASRLNERRRGESERTIR